MYIYTYMYIYVYVYISMHTNAPKNVYIWTCLFLLFLWFLISLERCAGHPHSNPGWSCLPPWAPRHQQTKCWGIPTPAANPSAEERKRLDKKNGTNLFLCSECFVTWLESYLKYGIIPKKWTVCLNFKKFYGYLRKHSVSCSPCFFIFYIPFRILNWIF